jgi:hypothetical protein
MDTLYTTRMKIKILRSAYTAFMSYIYESQSKQLLFSYAYTYIHTHTTVVIS